MKKLLIITFVLLTVFFNVLTAKADTGDWKMYFIMRIEMTDNALINHGQAVALHAQLLNRFSAEPGVANTVYTNWVQDGRQGEDPADWYFSDFAEPTTGPYLPVRWFYMGGQVESVDVGVSYEDTDYMLSSYWLASYSDAYVSNGAWMAMLVITNRIYENLPGWLSSGMLVPYCDEPLAGVPGPACP